MRRAVALGLGAATLASSSAGVAAAPEAFGIGARSSALAGSDVADADASTSAFGNPARAARAGTRLALGYGHAASRLRLSGADAGVGDASGVDVAAQLGGLLGDVTLGGALALHLPDRHLARIAFASPTAPALLRDDIVLQRTTVDACVAASLGRVALGVGATASSSTGGDGVRFALGEDAASSYADAGTQVTLPYALAPTAGIAVDLGPVGLGLRGRGALGIDVGLDTRATVALPSNPLNGTTYVRLAGTTAWQPATVSLGARWDALPGLRVHGALEYQRWRDAPAPAASLVLDVQLGTTPGDLEARFVRPALRDALAPRVGVEVGPLGERLTLRGGWSFEPSPAPAPTGYATLVDASRHTTAVGAGWAFGRVWGVDMGASAAVSGTWLVARSWDKPNDALPWAHGSVSGHWLRAAVSVEGAFR